MSDRYLDLHKSHHDDREVRVLNALKCLRIIRRFLQFDSAVDFGCGIGAWLIAAKQLGAHKVLGIDGPWIEGVDVLLQRNELAIHNLDSDTLNFSRSYDICISIEVGEHLPDGSSEKFCDNLTNASNFIVFSAAIPGQGGVNHINEQPPKYWVEKFWRRGFVPLELLRPVIANEPNMYPWLKQNLLVFMNYDLVHLRPELAQFLMPRAHFYHKYAPL